MLRSSSVLALAVMVFCLAAMSPTGAEAQQICAPAVYTPTAGGAGMTGTIMITFTSAACAGLATYAAGNPYQMNVTECTLLGGAYIGNSMFTLRAMATAGAAFSRKCSWYLKVTGAGPCAYNLLCKMQALNAGSGGLPVELMEFSVEDDDKAADPDAEKGEPDSDA